MAGIDTVVPSPAGERLQEVAELLAKGVERVRKRAAAVRENRENSTGLCSRIEAVSVPENRS
jgi:hypothetical protein